MKNETCLNEQKRFRGAGKLERSAVLKAICAGFKETTEPAVCLSGGRLV